MVPQTADPQHRENLQLLLGETDLLRQVLLGATAGSDRPPSPTTDAPLHPSPRLEQLCQLFGLVPFERQIILLCAAIELDLQFGALCAQLQGHPSRNYPTLGLAIALFPGADLRVFSNQQPLQRWQLVEVVPGYALAQAPLRLHPRILCYLTGQFAVTEALTTLWRPVATEFPAAPGAKLADSHQAIAHQLTPLLQSRTPLGSAPLVQLHGLDAPVIQQIMAQACQQGGLNLAVIDWGAVLNAKEPLAQIQQLCWREAILTKSVLLIDCHDVESHPLDWRSALQTFATGLETAFVLSTPERLRFQQRPAITLEIEPLTYAEQRQLWQTQLGPAVAQPNGQLDQLVTQFNLNSAAIAAACHAYQAELNGAKTAEESTPPVSVEPLPQLWHFCRVQARHGLDGLAQRIATNASWDDLVLPAEHKATLQTLAVHLRQRHQVYQTWGFAAKGSRGLGITALFSGQSGTGKTLAAEVVAKELQLDLYRIDLSAVVSKYIGETEKNLQRIFDAAEVGGAILLFDEADALFGKRTEVKDSHDRHANVEVSYLLQRMEAYRGLAVLTTNLKKALDQAFLRRIQFILTFPFPNAKAREEIWRRIFPPEMPTAGLKYPKLANLSVTGGNIRSIALNAAFLAAEAGEPVTMAHLLTATQREYAKLECTLTAAETSGWLTSKKPKSSQSAEQSWPPPGESLPLMD